MTQKDWFDIGRGVALSFVVIQFIWRSIDGGMTTEYWLLMAIVIAIVSRPYKEEH